MNTITELKKENKKRLADKISSIKEAKTIEGCNNHFIRNYLTKATAKNFETGKLSLKEVKVKMIERAKKLSAKNLEVEVKKVEDIKLLDREIVEITISINWKNNRTWGANPTAETKVSFSDNTCSYYSSGSIGGCGYDKESTAFALALNQCNEFKKLLIAKSEKRNFKGFSYGVNGVYKTYIGLSGGAGVSCYYSVFDELGFKMNNIASNKSFDCYHITKK